MIETSCIIPNPLGIGIGNLSHLSLAQEGSSPNPVDDLMNFRLGDISLVDFGTALLILLVGYLLALFAASLVKKLLKKTDIDNKLVSWISGSTEGGEDFPVEKWAGTLVFWVIFIFAIIGFFDRLQLTSVSAPLTTLLNEITRYIPRILGAAGLLGVAWVLATICRTLMIKFLDMFRLDERLNQQVPHGANESHFSLSHTLGNAIYWFIFLLFLPMILSTLELAGLLSPVQTMVNQILSSLPNILKALVIAAGGWLLAQIVSRIVTNLLAAVGFDRLSNQLGLERAMGTTSLSSVLGTIVYVVLMIPIAISALQALQINAISDPAISMLNQIFNVIPQVFIAGVILVLAYMFGVIVRDLVTNLLTNLGFNNIFVWLGIESKASPVSTPTQTTEEDEVIDDKPVTSATKQTPSEIVGVIALVGVMFFAVVTATDILGLTALTLIVEQLLIIAGRVLLGVIIFGIGLYLANLAHNLISSSGTSSAKLLAQAARIAIIIFVGAMALQQMGIASDIVNLAFGLLLGAIAVAIAIAFGLGGRDVASEQIREIISRLKQ